MHQIVFQDLGPYNYQQAWDYQENLLREVVARKNETDIHEAGYLLFVEHPHVYTLGKSGNDSNLLVNEDFLRSKGASFYRINRGGDITYHGPGQIVGYPIIDLDRFGIGIREYIFRLEEAVISTLAQYQIAATRLEGATGVWLDADKPGKTRKICAIGVRASRSVTMHGFAFNVNTDLKFYDYINPCGFTDKGVTSMEKELGGQQSMEGVKAILKTALMNQFSAEVIQKKS